MFLHRNLHVYTQRRNGRPDCMRTGNDEIINANCDLDDQWTLTGSSQDKTGVTICVWWHTLVDLAIT